MLNQQSDQDRPVPAAGGQWRAGEPEPTVVPERAAEAAARVRIGHFIDHYNFQRPHQGIDGLVPADRFFGAASEVLRTLKARVQANALELVRHGAPKTPFYLTGQAGGRPFSVHAEGERVILTRGEGRQEIELTPPAEVAAASDAVAGEGPSAPRPAEERTVRELPQERLSQLDHRRCQVDDSRPASSLGGFMLLEHPDARIEIDVGRRDGGNLHRPAAGSAAWPGRSRGTADP